MTMQAIQKRVSGRLLASKKRHAEKSEFSLHSGRSPHRNQLETYIAERYEQAHNASISSFMPILLEMTREGESQAALGLRPGHHRPMFLEQYLDSPIEQQIAKFSKQPIDRCALIEVGNLAVTHRGAGLLLFVILTMLAAEASYVWMIFTVTEEVEKLIRKLGFDLHYLIAADPARVKGGTENWGRYYDNNPRVMVGSLEQAVSVMKNSPALSAVLEDYRQEITMVSSSLSDYRRLADR